MRRRADNEMNKRKKCQKDKQWSTKHYTKQWSTKQSTTQSNGQES
jgi:hypothetical protein